MVPVLRGQSALNERWSWLLLGLLLSGERKEGDSSVVIYLPFLEKTTQNSFSVIEGLP